MTARLILAGIVACCVGSGAAQAGSCDRPASIDFAPGASSGQVGDELARGELGCWTLVARAGQMLSVGVDGPGNNIVFQLYRPGWRITRNGEGYGVTGRALPGANSGQDARQWSGRLPQGGRLLLVVGTTRGGGSYVAHVRVR